MGEAYHDYGAAARYLELCGLPMHTVRNAFYVFEEPPANMYDPMFSFTTGSKDTPKELQQQEYLYVKSRQKRWIRERFRPHVDALRAAVKEAQPKVVVAMGEFAMWALTGNSNLSQYRGSAYTTDDGYIVIPSYLPQTIDAQYNMRYYLYHDLQKALWYLNNPDYKPKNRKIYIRPTLGTLRLFDRKYLQPSKVLVHDVETAPSDNLMTCIGLAGCGDAALVIPFYDETKPDGNYWNERESKQVIKFLREVFQRPTKKIAHNALYDVMWERLYGIPYDPNHEDTMLMYHSMQPEASSSALAPGRRLQKDLGTLVSLFLKEPSWKNMTDFSKSNKTDA